MTDIPTHSFPACFVEMPISAENRRAPFYLAAEEYIAAEFPEDNYLYSWQIDRTCVMGRHQVAHLEINLDFCRREHIDVVRRKSGGGCIYADMGNVMWSLITPAGPVEPLFAEYAARVADGLRKLGAPVEVSGRNDIKLVDGGKICGNAFYHLTHRNIVHGTMLYDTDARLMAGALTPDTAKLEQAGVKSVRSRIALLKDYLDMDLKEVRRRLHEMLCDRKITLTEQDVERIERIETGYYRPEYLYGQSSCAAVVCSGRIKDCGQVDLHFTLRGSLIDCVTLTGDYFESGDAAAAFNQAFQGIPFTKEALRAAVSGHHPERAIRHLSAEQLMDLLEKPNNPL